MDELFDTYPRLYHYTTLQGAYGIIKEKSIWATHYRFLNYYSEIRRFRPKLIEHLIPVVRAEYERVIPLFPQATDIISSSGGLSAMVQHDAEVFVDSSYHALGDEIYIT